ncbi:MAG TPA: NAD(P)-dependent oxidoreductase, partial [Rhodothermales bacterium]|nr:NAD(P)-dependent oxidoreductase [Rhodothermales bacterium]
MSTGLRILLAEPEHFDAEAAAVLETLGTVERRALAPGAMEAALQNYDVIWFRLGHRVTRAMLTDEVRCRVLATPVTGLDHIDLDACRQVGMEVVSLRGETAFLKEIRATAEMTLALALALMRRIPQAADSVESGVWDRDRFLGRELYGKTAGIVGVGRLGEIVAGYFCALGMEVIGYDPRLDFPVEAARRMDTLDALLQEADVVSVHVNYDVSTRHLIDASAFAVMKPDAILVNTARGGVIEEAALLDALTSGRFGGAALDVLDGEPDID